MKWVLYAAAALVLIAAVVVAIMLPARTCGPPCSGVPAWARWLIVGAGMGVSLIIAALGMHTGSE